MGIGGSRETCGNTGNVRIVRAGGKVERYNPPITAQELMTKNPKHCVARSAAFRSEIEKTIVPPEEVLSPGEKYYLVPYHTVCTLFKRQSIDKTEFAELLSPLSSIYSSPAKIPAVRKTFLKKSPRKSWPRKSPARIPTKKVKEALQSEELEKRHSRKKWREEEKQILLQRRSNEADPLRPRRTLADHLQESPLLNLFSPPSKAFQDKFQEDVRKKDKAERSSATETPIEVGLSETRSAGDEGEFAKRNAELVLLIDSAQAYVSARRRFTRGGRSPTLPLSRAPSLAVRRRTWVPRLQTLPECSP